jgi:hypothetical protein
MGGMCLEYLNAVTKGIGADIQIVRLWGIGADGPLSVIGRFVGNVAGLHPQFVENAFFLH